ncbi:zinc-binding dehydrogenase [Lacrimispora saccharolytica]|uniref:Alcohol dehydrogenase zinc-binding domain protein n=1 Tax=Lacrimispora saccharolytica (strain ATCC 35040 / DSM 2544 / NRCC 2533 / WM1) TaxID=610130 RepID=D9R1G1_LACSW|nr:zinc-binding dehydrogenase [Lacrimispora saccharolytica]ADL06484.1 Alcohol dehydrogenase zinc-binding domain protein [[Clostridium] saccharolyticum WM1]QRV19433.1 zinc-binding dehydrogenase [Lacrimispora saccharolytica]
MKTKAVRMYGTDDLRLEEFELPQIKEDEILVKIMSDSICMSTYKLVKQGKKHKRAPQNMDTNPVIVGHECSGLIVEVGNKWKDHFRPGQKFSLQPALNYMGKLDSPGYSYEFCGGACTYCIMPNEVMELGCLLDYTGESFFEASLGEPMSCIIGGFHANYHTNKRNYDHAMGTKTDGNILIMGGCGPMGLGAVSYGLQFENKPKRIVVTDISDERIARAKEVISEETALERGIQLLYVNTAKMKDPISELMAITGGHGYDDVFVYVPVKEVAEMGDKLLAFDGCMNFFAGPSDSQFQAEINLYNCHYTSTHIMGTTGGNTDDLVEANQLSAKGAIEAAVMVTHIGGIDSIAEATKNLPSIPGGKKLTYTQFDMPLTAIGDFEELGKTDPLFQKLSESCKAHKGLWNGEAEKILFHHFGINPKEL